MSQQATLGDIVRYVLKERKGNAFKDYSEENIASTILRGVKEETTLYSTRNNGSVCGVIVCFKEEKTKTMFVNDILTSEPWVIPNFVMHFVKHFPSYTLSAMRKGKLINYKNTHKLCDKLLKGKI